LAGQRGPGFGVSFGEGERSLEESISLGEKPSEEGEKIENWDGQGIGGAIPSGGKKKETTDRVAPLTSLKIGEEAEKRRRHDLKNPSSVRGGYSQKGGGKKDECFSSCVQLFVTEKSEREK